MQLLTVHKIMIATSIVMCLLFALWAGWMAASGSPVHLVGTAAGVAIATALAFYLRYFIRKTNRRHQ